MADADDIVNNSLDADKPSHYIDWLSRKTELGDLQGIRFAAYIWTTGDADLVDNARELGIDVNDREIHDRLNRDYALIEANALHLLRRFGLTVSDEGHDNSGTRIVSLWFTDIGIKAGNVHRVIAAADGEPISTTNGTIDRVFPNGTEMLYLSISEIGQRLLDVTIEFTNTSEIEEWVALNLVENEEPDLDSPETFIRHFDSWRDVFELAGCVKDSNHPSTLWKNYETQGYDSTLRHHWCDVYVYIRIRKPLHILVHRNDPAKGTHVTTWTLDFAENQQELMAKYFKDLDTMLTTASKMVNNFQWLDFQVTQIQGRHDRERIELGESVDNPDDAESFMQHLDTDWKTVLAGYGFVPVTQHGLHSMVRSYKHIVFGMDYPVEIFAAPVWEDSIPGTQHIIKVPADLMAGTPTDPLNPDYIRFDFGVTTFSLDVPLFVLPIFLKRFIPLSVALEQGHQKNADRGLHVLVGSSQTMISQMNSAARRVARELRIKESVEEPNPDDPGAFMKHYKSWMDVFEKAGCTAEHDQHHDSQFWKSYELRGYNYRIYLQVKGVLWIIVMRNDALYGTTLFQRNFDFREGQELLLVKKFEELDKLLTKSIARNNNFDIVDGIVAQLQYLHQKKQERVLKYGESVDNPDDPQSFLQNMETNWQKILVRHGFKEHGISYCYMREYPDPRAPSHPVRIFAQHVWISPEYSDPENWSKRDINFPEYVRFTFGNYRPLRIPPEKLETFLSRFIKEADKIFTGAKTQGDASIGQGNWEAAKYWDTAARVARKLDILYENEPQVPPAEPDPDDPADVMRSHQHGLIVPELTRLKFKRAGTGSYPVRLFDEMDIEKYWYRYYQAADGSKHALSLTFYGGTNNELRIANWCPINKGWNNKLICAMPKTAAHLAAIIRDLDAAMERSAADSLAFDPEMATLERVVNYHNTWYDELLQGIEF